MNIFNYYITILVLGNLVAFLSNATDVNENNLTKDSEIKVEIYSRESAILSHAGALENAWRLESKSLDSQLAEQHFSSEFMSKLSDYSRGLLLERIQFATKQAQAVLIDMKDTETLLLLEGAERHTIAFEIQDSFPFKITSLKTYKKINGLSLDLTPENIEEKFSKLEVQHDFSGVVHLILDNKVKASKAFGYKDSALKVPNTIETIFGIGSRPIDFTTAGIYLLEQQGKLNLDDKLTKFYEAPSDKYEITISHLLHGKSGLPDFHHIKSDEDPDLTWIDKNEAIQRILSQTLQFKPGQEERHSHSAFVLLASIIEEVSGQKYFDFMAEEFFKAAGMMRTGEYGSNLGLNLAEFAAGGGPSKIGKTNIPPEWGKTSWLIKGSGGMYSTVGDLVKFYNYVRNGQKLKGRYAVIFSGPSINVDGSDRGFELFSSFDDEGNDMVFVMSNMPLPNPLMFEIRSEFVNLIRTN